MKTTNIIALLACVIGFAIAAPGTQVDSITAASTVKGWIMQEGSPMGAKLGNQIASVESYKDAAGSLLYHVVYLKPNGFVIVSADDRAEPVVAFASQGRYDPSEKNPLGALISRDLPNRAAHARKHANSAGGLKNQGKWRAMQSMTTTLNSGVQPKSLGEGSPNLDDIRIAPLIATIWNQGTNTSGLACENFFTPPHEAGNVNNAVCGCVATALAQVMYYYQYPINGVGTSYFDISFDGNPAAWYWPLRGGDNHGGPYQWANMPLDPNNATVTQCAAIGALTYDAGVAVHMQYTDTAAGSGAYLTNALTALLTTFQYANVILTEANTINTNFDLADMINPNLDARRPVIFGIDNADGGHCIVCDGYGYDNYATLYHHLNMGWGGQDNAWYHLPFIDLTDTAPYYNFNACLYNVFTNGNGEIISGRVLDTNGAPVYGAQIIATSGKGGIITATTDANGIYALVGVPSDSTCTVTATNAGCFPVTSNIVTQLSHNMGTNCGNVWGVNFTLIPAQGPPVFTLQPANQTVTIGSSATFNAGVKGQLPLTYQWQYISSGSSIWNNVIDDGAHQGSQTPTLTINPANLSMNGESFQCVAINSLGSTTSAPPASLVVNGLVPTFVIQPQNQIIVVGSNATFSAVATGTPSISYQWQFQPSGSLAWVNVNDDGTNSGSQTSELTISQVDLSMNGKPLRCVASNLWGNGTSTTVSLGISVNNSTPIFLGTLAGLAPTSGGTDGLNSSARFNNPHGIAVDNYTNVFIADMYNNVIRKLTPSGTNWTVSTIAGLAGTSGTNDGTGTNARFNAPYGIAVDGGGNVYVSDTYNQTIRKLTPAGTNWAVSTIAGLAGTSGTNDGINARFKNPTGIAADNSGSLYVTDAGSCSIRKLTFNGSLWTASTIAGGRFGSNDGTNRNAQFGNPYGIAASADGTVFVADKYFNTIRQLTPSGTNWVVTTIAGKAGSIAGSADGIGSAARLNQPTGIASGADGNLYVADAGNNIIRRLAPTGTNWTVFTVAGLAGSSGSVDGIGTNIRLNGPFGVAVDLNTNVYVSDAINNTIRGPDLASSLNPKIVRLTMQNMNNKVAFSWNAVVGNTYLIQYKTNLNQVTWSNLTTITASNWTGSGIIPFGTEPQRFFRVVPAQQ